MNTATRVPFFLRFLAILVIAFVADSPAYSQFTPAEPPPMAPAEFAPDYVDQIWKWSIRTDTLPGWLYSVEESTDLSTWTLVPNSYFYGNGSEMKCFICDGPPPPSEVAPANGNGTGTGGWSWQVHHFSLTLRMQEAGASSSYFLQRESADPESPNAWQTNLTEALPPQVPGTRNFSMLEWADPTTHLLYWVDVHVIIGTDPPPTADAAHPPLEADLAIYDHIKPQLLARLLTPDDPNSPSNTPSNSKFARVRRVATDSNGNGIFDAWELANGYAPFALPGQFAYFAPDQADSDNDGFTDAEELTAGKDPYNKNSHPPAETTLITVTKEATFHGTVTPIVLVPATEWTSTVSWRNPLTTYGAFAGHVTSPGGLVPNVAQPSFPDNAVFAPDGTYTDKLLVLPRISWVDIPKHNFVRVLPLKKGPKLGISHRNVPESGFALLERRARKKRNKCRRPSAVSYAGFLLARSDTQGSQKPVYPRNSVENRKKPLR